MKLNYLDCLLPVHVVLKLHTYDVTSISYDKQSMSMSWVTKLVHVVYKKKFGEQGALYSACNLGTKPVLTTKSDKYFQTWDETVWKSVSQYCV